MVGNQHYFTDPIVGLSHSGPLGGCTFNNGDRAATVFYRFLHRLLISSLI